MEHSYFESVNPTITNKTIARTFKITRIFSIRAASLIPRDNNNAVKIITIAATKSIIPPFAPKGLDKDLGNAIPKGDTSPLKLAENQKLQRQRQ